MVEEALEELKEKEQYQRSEGLPYYNFRARPKTNLRTGAVSSTTQLLLPRDSGKDASVVWPGAGFTASQEKGKDARGREVQEIKGATPLTTPTYSTTKGMRV